MLTSDASTESTPSIAECSSSEDLSVGRIGAEALGTSADSLAEASGPLWMEDPLEAKRNRSRPSIEGLARDPSFVRAVFSHASSPEKGIRALIEQGHLGEGGAADIASFFLRNDGKLDPSKVGDYLGGNDSVQREALQHVLSTIQLEGLPLDSALRKTISMIKLPGESQKIDRIIEQFAIQWLAANPGAVDHVDTAQIIAFSLVMLNVDAHNDNIKRERKMTLAQYKNNLRGICKDGSSPDADMLTGLYNRVCRHEWQVEERSQMRVLREGWLLKVSSKEALYSPRRVYGVLSMRVLFLYRDFDDQDPVAYLRLEGLCCKHFAQSPKRFELRLAGPEGGGVEGRMVKLSESPDGTFFKTLSKHVAFTFAADNEVEARAWVRALQEVTCDDVPIEPAVDITARSRSMSLAPSGPAGRGGEAISPFDAMRVRAVSTGGVSPLSVETPQTDAAGSGLYAEREMRTSLSRERYEVGASLKMLERKYVGVQQRLCPPGTAPELGSAERRRGPAGFVSASASNDSLPSCECASTALSEEASCACAPSTPTDSAPAEGASGDSVPIASTETETASSCASPPVTPAEGAACPPDLQTEGAPTIDEPSEPSEPPSHEAGAPADQAAAPERRKSVFSMEEADVLGRAQMLTVEAATTAEAAAVAAGWLGSLPGSHGVASATQAAAQALVQATKVAALARGLEAAAQSSLSSSAEAVAQRVAMRAAQTEDLLLSKLLEVQRAQRQMAHEIEELHLALRDREEHISALQRELAGHRAPCPSEVTQSEPARESEAPSRRGAEVENGKAVATEWETKLEIARAEAAREATDRVRAEAAEALRVARMEAIADKTAAVAAAVAAARSAERLAEQAPGPVKLNLSVKGSSICASCNGQMQRL